MGYLFADTQLRQNSYGETALACTECETVIDKVTMGMSLHDMAVMAVKHKCDPEAVEFVRQLRRSNGD